MQMALTALSAGTLKGDTVRNLDGDEIGVLHEIMIDLDTGRVAYVVMTAGGFLGVGEKYFAIPWGMVEVDTENHQVVIDLDKETIGNAPGFDKDNWPKANDAWLRDVYAHYDEEPFWATDQ